MEMLYAAHPIRMVVVGLSLLMAPVPAMSQCVCTFSPRAFYPTGSSTGAVVTADFNGDGRTDLALGNTALGGGVPSVSVLFGSGAGTFQPAVNYAAGTYPWAVAAEDFNGDNRPDLAVANWSIAHTVSVLVNNGSGAFQSAVVYPMGNLHPIDVKVGDFNTDGVSDLAVLSQAGSSSEFGQISILFGSGNGSFYPGGQYPVGLDAPIFLAVGELNTDERPDIVVSNQSSGTISVLLSSGAGAFHPAITYAVGTQTHGIAVSDFNRDTHGDIAVVDWVRGSGFGRVAILIGNGDGTFQPQVTHPAGSYPFTIAVADFNSDGALDLVVSDFSGPGSLLLGVGNGNFHPMSAVTVEPRGLAVDDFNGDGRPDVASAGFGPPGRTGVVLNTSPACGCATHCFCSSDFNGDDDSGTDADIEAFFACLGGSCCPGCGSVDFNGDGDSGTDADIEAFFRVLAGGAC